MIERMRLWISIIVVLLWGLIGSARAQKKVDFAKEIQPIFQQHCVKCHGPEKQKADMRLDSKTAAMKGGKDGVVIVPGNADKSEMVRRIRLPKSDDDRMPNEGEPLSKAQTDLIRDWINQGAEWPAEAVAGQPAPTKSESVLPPGFKPGANELKAIAQLGQRGVDVRPIAMNVNWREANFRSQGTNITDAALAPLKDIASLIEVNLGGTRITDAGLASLKGLTNLMRLHLELAQITDAGLSNLKGLHRLAYLNLYGTGITDAGLDPLKGLTNLQQLYVWQTKVTSNGVAKLKQALPNISISTGWDVEALAKKPEAPDTKK